MLHSVPAGPNSSIHLPDELHTTGPAGATRDFRGYSPYSTNLFLRECVIFSVQCDIFSEHYAFKIVHYKYTTDKIFLIGQAVCRRHVLFFFSLLQIPPRPHHRSAADAEGIEESVVVRNAGVSLWRGGAH
jgi:hypothetical protein